MEREIEKARDEWISKFKIKWDRQIRLITIEKDKTIDRLLQDCTDKTIDMKKDRDQKIKDIRSEFVREVSKLKLEVDIKRTEIEKEFNNKLSQFLSSNLKQPTIYDNVCSYILNFKSTLFQDQGISDDSIVDYSQDEPYVITLQDMDDVQLVESYNPIKNEVLSPGSLEKTVQLESVGKKSTESNDPPRSDFNLYKSRSQYPLIGFSPISTDTNRDDFS